jgi:hypothetical protein
VNLGRWLLTIDEHYLFFDNAIGTSPVIFLSERQGVVPDNARYGGINLVVSVDIKAISPTSTVGSSVATLYLTGKDRFRRVER